jgi:hypothetical protein
MWLMTDIQHLQPEYFSFMPSGPRVGTIRPRRRNRVPRRTRRPPIAHRELGRVRLADPPAGVTADLSGGACACALDAVLPIVPSEAVVIAALVLATKGELSIWLVALAAATGGFLVRLAWPRFAAADAVGASLWAAYATGLGYLGGETFERRPLYGFLFGVGVALLVVVVVEAARRLRRHGARAGGRGAVGGQSGPCGTAGGGP